MRNLLLQNLAFSLSSFPRPCQGMLVVLRAQGGVGKLQLLLWAWPWDSAGGVCPMAGTERVIQGAEPGANAPPDTAHSPTLGRKPQWCLSTGWTASPSTAMCWHSGGHLPSGDASPAGGPRVSQRCCGWDTPALCAPGSSAHCLTRDLSFLSWGHFHITWDTTRTCLWKTLPEQLNAYVPQIANAAASQHSQIRHWEEKGGYSQ